MTSMKIEKLALVGIPVGAMFLLPKISPLAIRVVTIAGRKLKTVDRLGAAVEVSNVGDVALTVDVDVYGTDESEQYKIPIIRKTVDINPGETIRIPETGLMWSEVIPADAPTGIYHCFAWARWDTQQAFKRLDEAWDVEEPIRKADIEIKEVG